MQKIDIFLNSEQCRLILSIRGQAQVQNILCVTYNIEHIKPVCRIVFEIELVDMIGVQHNQYSHSRY